LNLSIRLPVIALAGWLAVSASAAERSYSPYTGESFPRNLYWGDTHVHSSWSVDAGNTGNLRIGPDHVFRFARGEEVEAHNGMKLRLRRPLDFVLLSDHAEYLGVMPRLDAGDELARRTEAGERWYQYRKNGELLKLFGEFAASMLSLEDAIGNEALEDAVWQDVVANAERYNQPGRFTAFIGYEWTSSSNGNNLHRNVIFRDGADRTQNHRPFSSLDSADPEDLWRALDRYQQRTGGRVMAIPHNSNLSGGLMFTNETFSGEPFTPAYAKTRAYWEPMVEVTQYKGDSETHPILSPDDAFAEYETWNTNLAGHPNEDTQLPASYIRSALKSGLALRAALGVNPFAFGLIGSTDSHTGFATAEEDNYWGKFTKSEARPGRWNQSFYPEGVRAGSQHYEWEMAASGYAGIWARENTREALFDALARRETYATTGPRIAVRFFGGWRFEPGDESRPDVAVTGYSRGVPMGATLPARADAAAPTFLVSVLKDPEGANLDRVQIVKGWLEADGRLRERVYDVALSDDRKIVDGRANTAVGSTVDVENATWTNTIGAVALSGVWLDPEFDPQQSAFYYLRALEVPTPRWTAYDAKFFGDEIDPKVPMTTQERAYTSPIWYTP
jgi:hypothetical protein